MRIVSFMTLISWGLVFESCAKTQSGDPKKTDPADEPIQVTAWSKNYEVFIEHKRIVAETAVTFTTHITELRSCEPKKEGPITFVLNLKDAKPIEYTEPNPAADGIYKSQLTFSQGGRWQVQVKIIKEDKEEVIELPKITVFSTKEEAVKAHIHGAPEGISFLKEPQWKLKMRCEKVVNKRMVRCIKAPALVTSHPELQAHVFSPATGYLQPLQDKSTPNIGDVVKKGQVLALIQLPFSDFTVKLVEAEAESVKTKIALDQAKSIFNRIKKLYEEKSKSKKELDDADFSVQTAQANYDAAVSLKEALNKTGAIFVKKPEDGKSGLLAFELKSPIDGTIVKVSAAQGEYVSIDKSVFSVLDISTVLVEARVLESDIEKVKNSQDAKYELPNDKGEFISLLKEDKGKVLFLGSTVDTATRTVPLIYQVNNSDAKLRIGMMLSLEIETEVSEDAIAIPESAIVEEEGIPLVFVQLSGEVFEKRSIEIGFKYSGFVQVKSGLSSTDRIVTKGAYSIRLASLAPKIDDGHGHHGHAH